MAVASLFNRATQQPPGAAGTGIPPITAPWPVADIVYVSIVGTVMLAALLEWILWLLAFLYCLVKVYQKATGEGRWTIRFLAVVNMVFFVGMRCIFLPVMVVTLPLPPQIVQYFPKEMISILQWLATHNIGRTRRIKYVLDEYTAPKVVIIMPCYNEAPEILLRTVDSIVDCDYPPSCLHVFLSFDGDQENELFLNTIEKLGVPLTLESYPKSIDVVYRRCRITVSRFPHGGKRSCQKKTFRLIDKVYQEYLRRHDDLFVLFIDSDCILDKYCIQNFMYEMELKPGSKHNMLAQTGIITSTTEKHSLITVLQDMEYVHGQLFERTVESGCGAVTCLPGALTILRFSAFRKVAKFYFADKAEQCDDLFDYGKCHLGEDRWLTHLFMIGSSKRYQIQMNTGAFCKTEAVQTFKSLLKQRRRWFLGFITNESCMLTDIRLWKRYPLLCVIRLAQNTIRTTALLFFILVISLISTSQKIANLPVGFIAVSLGLNWLLMLYFGAKLGRYKIMLYPLMFVLNPFLNWMYMVYGIFTAGQRTWGGPRADAGKADEKTSPADVVATAEATGNDLNVVPETFKATAEARTHRHMHAPLQPPEYLVGRFTPAEELPGGYYSVTNDSGMLHGDMTMRYPGPPSPGASPYGSPRGSWDSVASMSNRSASRPRRVESIVDADGIAMYRNQQAEQRPAGGAYYEAPRPSFAAVLNMPRMDNHDDSASVHSADSESSIPMHFSVPAKRDLVPERVSSPPTRVPTRPTDEQKEQAAFKPPVKAYRPGLRVSQSPAGKSPLARKSFTRIATDEPTSTEDAPPMPSVDPQVRQQQRQRDTEIEVRVPRRGSEDTEQRGRRMSTERRHGRTVSVDEHGRRRLSRQGGRGRNSREPSRE